MIGVLSLQTVNSPWVRKEIQYALHVEQTRQGDGYRVIPLLLPGMTPAALGNWFDEEPVPIELKPGGLSEALTAILAAIASAQQHIWRKRANTDGRQRCWRSYRPLSTAPAIPPWVTTRR